MKSIITVGSGNSGGGAIHDYLKNRKDFVAPFYGNEFRLICDPDGINNLYKNLYQNFSINNSAIAFERFYKFSILLTKIKGSVNNKRKKIFNNNSIEIITNYLNKITYLEYNAMPQFQYIGLNLFNKMLFKIQHSYLGRNINLINLFQMKLPIDEKNFLIETRKLIMKLCEANISSKNKNTILDQAASFWHPEDYFKYFDDLKIVIINRDPRSIFYSMLSRNSKSYPSSNVSDFVKWYKNIRNKQSKINNKNIYFIQYENFLKNHEKESKKLNNFLKISNKIKSDFDLEHSKRNMIKASEKLAIKDQNFIKHNLKSFLAW